MDATASLKQAFHMEKGTFGTVIRQARKAKKLSAKDIADTFKVSVQAVHQWERDETLPSSGKIFTLCKMLEIDPAAAQSGELRDRPDASRAPAEATPLVEVGALQSGPLDVEVWGVAVGGDDADFHFNGEVINRVARPPGLKHASTVFALHIVGESMSPRFEPGELIYCQKVPPVAGDDVVVELYGETENAAGKSFVKRFVRREKGVLFCEQFNPVGPVEFDLGDVKNVFRIIPLRELMGG